MLGTRARDSFALQIKLADCGAYGSATSGTTSMCGWDCDGRRL